jgi:3-hydroxyisobutyrate dehydrogenase-like beta-hydroxyacid dehydrogenase
MLGTGGAAAALRPGTTWIDMTSNSPNAVTEIRNALLDRGVQVLDAPAGGGVAAARQGSLQLLVGGKPRSSRGTGSCWRYWAAPAGSAMSAGTARGTPPSC